MIKLQINKRKKLVKIYDYNKNVDFKLTIEENGELYYKSEDMFYSSLTAFIDNKIENPKVEVEFYGGDV